MTKTQALVSLGRVLSGKAPMLSIEITRECPLSCPGCYAYGGNHLGGEVTLTQLNDLRGQALVDGVIGLVKKHKPVHLSIVGGEPLVRHRELSKILPVVDEMGVYTLIVSSGVIPYPAEWDRLKRTRVGISIDGLQPEHDARRKPATYERILQNIQGRWVHISWVITRPMLQREGYLDEYLRFWTARPEIDRVWLNIYTPQIGERSEEALTAEDRRRLIELLPGLKKKYPKLLMPRGVAEAFASPPEKPQDCTFAKMSVNYSADLETRIEPCFYGGQPDCSQCGCSVTAGLHWIGNMKLAGPLRASHLINGTIAAGALVHKLTGGDYQGVRWQAPGGHMTRLPQE